MQKGSTLQFECLECQKQLTFFLFNLNAQSSLDCKTCGKQYFFDDPDLMRQLTKFQKLCETVKECEEILDQTSVGVDIEGKQALIPYKLLLARMNASLSLVINGKPLEIFFRFEPLEVRQ